MTRRLLLGLAALACLASCGSVRYYSQAIQGQAQIWWRSKPIPKVLEKEPSDSKLHRQLTLVQELRAFAKEHLQLPAHHSYHHYADLGRPHVVWVVYAAPEFSIEAKSWWYPVVGSLKYRGFFDEEIAKKEGEKLKTEGYDVLVGGVDGYSTLGWFHDPVLNTFLNRGDSELAELVFHELTHVKLFVPGDTDFNEALATAVGQEGVRRWLRSKGQTKQLAEYEADLAKDHEIIRLLLAKRDELKGIYARSAHLPVEQQRAAKAAAIAGLNEEYQAIKRRWKDDSRYDALFKTAINNARLCTISAYYDFVPAFDRKLASHHGDLKAFFKEMSSYKRLDPNERRRQLGMPPIDP